MTASRTIPTLCVLVIITGPSRNPDSSTHVVPVISPLPLSENHPANTGSDDSLPRGRMAVTPVRTGPEPTTSLPLPEISVVWPTSTPLTSVMASSARLRLGRRGLGNQEEGEKDHELLHGFISIGKRLELGR